MRKWDQECVWITWLFRGLLTVAGVGRRDRDSRHVVLTRNASVMTESFLPMIARILEERVP